MNKRHILSSLLLLLSLATVAQDIEVVNIENPAVQAYMADDTYLYNSNYSTSVVNKYATSLYGQDLDLPQGKTVTWNSSTAPSDISRIVVTVSENPDFTDAATHYPSREATSYIIRNMLPQRVYYYKVEEVLFSGRTNRVAAGVFRTVGQVRMIQVRNNNNVRDLGGWMTQYGMRIRYGLMYRSGSLDKITEEGRHDFADNLNVGAELDLRSESRLTQSKLGADKDFLLVPHEAGTKGVTQHNHVYPGDLAWIVDRLQEGKAVNWHCAIGCDRCGALSFLIEGLLGMSEVDLCRDFELSTFSKRPRPRSHVLGMMKHIKTFGPEDDLATCFYNYWLSIGADEEDMNFLISYCLEPYQQEGYEY